MSAPSNDSAPDGQSESPADGPDRVASGRAGGVDFLAQQSFVSLTTFRRDGTAVATAVWIARAGDELVVITVDASGKVKRLRRDPRVELRPCDVRGDVVDGATRATGIGRLVTDPEGVAQVRRAIAAKYRLARLGDIVTTLTFGLARRKPRVGIRITLDDGSPPARE